MARAPKTDIPRTIGTQDVDVCRIIDAFKGAKGYPTHSEAMEKLLMRAERVNLHRMTDEEFEALIETCADSIQNR